MNYDVFNFLAWSILASLCLFLIIGVIFLFKRKWKGSLKAFGMMAIFTIAFLTLFNFAYPEELLETDASFSEGAENEVLIREKLVVNINEIEFDENLQTISAKITANLPDNTDVLLHLRSEKPNESDKRVALLLDYEAKVVDGEIHLDNTPIYSYSGVPQENTSYYLTLDIPINQERNKDWLESEFDKGFSNIDVRDDGYERYANLEVADTIIIENGFSPEEVVKLTEEKAREQEKQRQINLENKKKNAIEIRFAELKKNPEKHANSYIKYQGEILQIMEDESSSVIRLAVTKDSYGYDFNDVIYITYNKTTKFVDEDVVTVYGTVLGSHSYESQAGYNITLPHIEADIIE